MNCPLCQHRLHHESPPLLRLPPLRVYCDGCQGWLAWEPTNETRQVRAAPLCPACKRPMVLKNLKAGGVRYGCETWQECGTGMRGEHDRVAIDVPVYELVPWDDGALTDDERHFNELYEARVRDWERIEARGERYRQGRWWEG